MKARVLISLARGRVDAADWNLAAREEPPIKGSPAPCDECPLRRGGEWEAGFLQVMAEPALNHRLLGRRWGCHEAPRPCAGMRRLLLSSLPSELQQLVGETEDFVRDLPMLPASEEADALVSGLLAKLPKSSSTPL